MMNEKTIRTAKWDNLKFLLILCVVVGHFYSQYSKNDVARSMVFFIYSFHMPAFVFVSGLFSKRTVNEKRYDKMFSFFILFLVVKYVRFLIMVITNQRFSFSYTDIPDVSWYALAVFVYYLVTVFFRQFDEKYMMIFAVVVACVSGYAKEVGTFLSLSRILTFYPFFLLGYYLKAEDIQKFTEKKVVKAGSVLLLILLAYVSFMKIDNVYWLVNIFRAKSSYKSLSYYGQYGAMLRLSWMMLAMLLTMALISLTPSVRCIFTKWGSRTMQVYALHFFPLRLFFDMFNGKAWVKNISSEHYMLLVFVIAALITCLLSIKPIGVVMDKIIYPKKSNRVGE